MDPTAYALFIAAFGLLAVAVATVRFARDPRRDSTAITRRQEAERGGNVYIVIPPAQPQPERVMHRHYHEHVHRVEQPAPASVPAALYGIPGAEVRPPRGDLCSSGVIVATLDAAFLAQVRAALQRVQDVTIYLIGGEAPADPRFDPHARGRYLWAEIIRDGAPLGPEPRRRMELSTLRHQHPGYWVVRPAGSADDALFPDLLTAAAPAALPMRRERPAAYITPGAGSGR